MLSLRRCLRLHCNRTTKISSFNFSEQSPDGVNKVEKMVGKDKEEKVSGENLVPQEQPTSIAQNQQTIDTIMKNLPTSFKSPEYDVATQKPNWKEVELNESEKAAIEQKQGLTVTEMVDGEVVVRKAPTYDVAWPEVVGGEVQVKNSSPPPKMDVAKSLKGVGVWDIGTEDHPYRGHTNTAPYPVPTAPPPLGPSRLETWRSLDIKPVPQLINKPPDPSPGVSGKIIDAIAEHMHSNPRHLQPRHLIMENTDHRLFKIQCMCTKVELNGMFLTEAFNTSLLCSRSATKLGMRIRPRKPPWASLSSANLTPSTGWGGSDLFLLFSSG